MTLADKLLAPLLVSMALPAQAKPINGDIFGTPSRILSQSYGGNIESGATMWTFDCITLNDTVVLNASWLRGDPFTYTLTAYTQHSDTVCVDVTAAVVAFGVRETNAPIPLPDTFGSTLLVDPLIILPMEFYANFNNWGWQAYRLRITLPRPIDHVVQGAFVMNGVTLLTKGIRFTF
jgi:hypothetical protein